jgi:hypothetical protein
MVKNKYPKKRVMLLYFLNDKNYGGFQEYKREDKQIVRLYWKIDGRYKSVDLFEYINYLSYNPQLNRLIVVTFNDVYLYNPETLEKEKIEVDKNYILNRCWPGTDSNTLILSASFVDDSPLNEPLHYYCIHIGLVSKKHIPLEICDMLFGVCNALEGGYYLKTHRGIYRTDFSETFYYRNRGVNEDFLIGRWPNDCLIYKGYDKDKDYVKWADATVLCLNNGLSHYVITDSTLWIIEKGCDLKLYDIQGELLREQRLSKKIFSIGRLDDKGVWVLYNDMSVECYDNSGLLLTTSQPTFPQGLISETKRI